MKPRILITMHYMEIGGAESSLIGLLEALDPERVDIDLFIYSHRGVFMSAIPGYVNLLPQNRAYSMFEKPIKDVVKLGYPRIAIARLLAKFKCKHFCKKHPSDKQNAVIHGYVGGEVSKVVPDIQKGVEYDLAISYMNPHDFVLNHVKAKQKLAWIHTDYSEIQIDVEKELMVWSGYDKIVSISLDVTRTFLEIFPSLANRIINCENMLPASYIEQKSLERLDITDENSDYGKSDLLTLCSIGRIGYAKNYDNVPYMAKALKEMFMAQSSWFNDFRWYIVGPGAHDDIDKLSDELGVRDNVLFLGATDNPYPYIKNCDIYVHPSRYEGKSIVVREAQVLCKPVIITNYPTAKSQINDGVDGVICDMDNKAVAQAIYDLATNKDKQNKIIEYLLTHDNAGVSEVNKIYNLIDC